MKRHALKMIAMLILPTSITMADGGLTIGALIAGSAAAAEVIHGPRAWAYADADGVSVSDTKGGWFSVNAHALAAASGPKGSSLTTDANAHIGLLAASAEVTYQNRVKGNQPGAYYWGQGAALGGLFARDFPGPASSRSAVSASLDATLGPLSLTAADGMGLGTSAFEELTIFIDAYLFPHVDGPVVDPNDIPDLSTAYSSQSLLYEHAQISSIDGGLDFSAATPLFSSAEWSGSGATRSLPESSLSFNFDMDVPEEWESFDLLIDYGIIDSTGAVPEPGTLALLVLGSLVTLRRQRRLAV